MELAGMAQMEVNPVFTANWLNITPEKGDFQLDRNKII